MSRYFIYYIEEDEFRKVIQNKKPVQFTYDPYLQVEPIETYDSNSFRCRLLHNEYDSTGLGHIGWKYVTRQKARGRGYYDDFVAKKNAFFTTDGVSFYKPINFRFDEQGMAEILLRLITLPNYSSANTAFMLMPFRSEKLNQFYEANISNFLKEKLNIKVTRADDYNDTDVIIDTIYREIEKAEFVLCEITECNKNVFYELGYAKALNKNIILIAQSGTETKFFDLDHIRRIEFNTETPEVFRSRLLDTINTLRGKI